MAMPLPADEELTRNGLEPRGKSRVLILACGALAREILAITQANGFNHIDLKCLPAILHNHPERIAPAVVSAVAEARSEGYNRVFLAYADCGTGGDLKKVAAEFDIEMLPGPHCYAFFEGTEGFLDRAEDEFTAFYLTDFLARQFDAFVWEALGLDRHPELRDTYFGHYEKLVYQAQTDDPELTLVAESCAARLGLPFERRLTGYGDLGREIISFGHGT